MKLMTTAIVALFACAAMAAETTPAPAAHDTTATPAATEGTKTAEATKTDCKDTKHLTAAQKKECAAQAKAHK